LWVLGKDALDVGHLRRLRVLTTDWTPFLLAQIELTIVAKHILLRLARHEPVSVQAKQVKAVETLLKRNQVLPFSKTLGFIFTKLIETNETATFDRVVVSGHKIN
jgi:signal transduction histidine kinase